MTAVKSVLKSANLSFIGASRTPGDVIFYDWQDSGYGDNTGASDHVGLVASVDGNVINIIEGNCGNMVQFTARQIDGKYIRGYGLPDYASMANEDEPEEPEEPEDYVPKHSSDPDK